MTVYREYTVRCDGCSKWERYQVRNQKTAIKKARQDGWTSHEDGEYCPGCNTK